jgi:hypothetical protein
MGEKGIALNLKLKENYKQKFIGDIEASYGINDAARIHNNLFKFSKKGNMAIISDYNSGSSYQFEVSELADLIQSTFYKDTNDKLDPKCDG